MSKKTPRALSLLWIGLTVLAAMAGGIAGARWMHEQSLNATARNTVVWISIDGLRGDYVRRGELPFFKRLRAEGATTEQLRPAFPSATFPSHSAQATGVTADQHGITGNTFYDSANGLLFRHPNEAALLQAEPIWLTAQRQGVHTAVYDWPLSFDQQMRVHDDLFLSAFEAGKPDQERLDRLLNAWQGAIGKPSAVALHLLMGYIVATDKPGHVYGPDSAEILREMVMVDAMLAAFSERAIALWKSQRHSPKDRLFFIFSTDHGMSATRTIVSFERLLDFSGGLPEHRIVTTGNVGHVFLDSTEFPPGSEARAARLRELQQRIHAMAPEFQSFLRNELPPNLGYAHPTRTGDLVIMLPVGYAFGSVRSGEIMADVSSNPDLVRGMHGYDVNLDSNMLGFFAIWEPAKPKALDLGVVSWEQLHPTVAKLLGIRPAAGAKGTPLAIAGAD